MRGSDPLQTVEPVAPVAVWVRGSRRGRWSLSGRCRRTQRATLGRNAHGPDAAHHLLRGGSGHVRMRGAWKRRELCGASGQSADEGWPDRQTRRGKAGPGSRARTSLSAAQPGADDSESGEPGGDRGVACPGGSGWTSRHDGRVHSTSRRSWEVQRHSDRRAAPRDQPLRRTLNRIVTSGLRSIPVRVEYDLFRLEQGLVQKRRADFSRYR